MQLNDFQTMTKSEMLKLGGFPIQIGDFLSPATFWGCKVDKNSDLLQMETKMTELFQKGNATPLSKPVVGVLVAAEKPGSHKWVRSKIVALQKAESQILATVFSVDYGHQWIVDLKNLYPLPEFALYLWPHATQFTIYGILPTTMCFKPDTNTFSPEVSIDWYPAALDKVKLELSRSCSIFFVKRKDVDHQMLGDAYLTKSTDAEPVSLKDMLLQTQMALYLPDLFEKEYDRRVRSLAGDIREGFTGPMMNLEVTKVELSQKIDRSQTSVDAQHTDNAAAASQSVLGRSQFKGTMSRENYPLPVIPNKSQERALPYHTQAVQQNQQSSGQTFWDRARKNKLKSDEETLNAGEIGQGEAKDMPGSRLDCKLDVAKNPSLPLLLHGHYKEIPLNELLKAPFHSDVNKALDRSGFSTLTNVQRYMWPAINRGINVVAIGDSTTGKSIGFLAPLASKHLDLSLQREVVNSNGPFLMILCATEQKAEKTESNLRSLTMMNLLSSTNPKTRSEKKVQITLITSSFDVKELAMELLNGCHILVSTPAALKKVLNFWPGKVTDFKRLRALVLDDADVLLYKHDEEVGQWIAEIRKEEAESKEPVQIVLTSRRWSHEIEKFVTSIKHPEVIVPCGLEMLAYGGIAPGIHAVNPNTRDTYVLQLIRGKHCKTMVCCSTVEEAEGLCTFLISYGLNNVLLAVNEDQTTVVKSNWDAVTENPAQYPVVVVADEMLVHLEIGDAFLLVHYTIPLVQYKFNYRMASVLSSVPNMLKAPQESQPKPEIHILVDLDKDVKQIPALSKFMERIGAPNSEAVLKRNKELAMLRERATSDTSLCHHICQFGRCSEKSLCGMRHTLNIMDNPAAYLPREGELKISVNEVHDATHFTGKILEHKDHSNKVNCYSNKEGVDLAFDIAEHYSEEENRSRLGTVQLGVTCAVESSTDVFHRVQIELIVSKDPNGNAVTVQVKSLDEGWKCIYKAVVLLHLPKKLREVKPQAVDFYLCGLQPNEEEKMWGLAVTKLVKSWIEDAKNPRQDECFLSGKIGLAMAGSIWLTSLVFCQRLGNGEIVEIYKFEGRMLKNKVAVANPEHLPALKALCEEAGIELPKTSESNYLSMPATKKIDTSLRVADRAFLSSSNMNNVKVTHVESPSSFFVQNSKFIDLLDSLLNDISDHQLEQSKKAWKSVTNEAENFILAKCPSNQTWNRAQIAEVKKEELVCFFVDQGTKESVNVKATIPIPHLLLNRLPCQAIECSLFGVKPKDSQVWSQDAVNDFTDLVRSFDDTNNSVFVKVCGKTKSLVTGGWHYFVRLYIKGEQKEAGAALVQLGLASFEQGTEAETLPDEFWQNLMLEELVSERDHDEDVLDTKATSYATEKEADNTKAVKCDKDLAKSDEINWENFEVEGPASFFEKSGLDKDKLEMLKSYSEQPLKESCGPEVHTAPVLSNKDKGEKQATAKPVTQAVVPKTDNPEPVKKLRFISTCYDTKLLWSQTKEHIRIKILLVGVVDYYLKITPYFADFATRCEGKAYCVNINLFGYVIPNKCIYKAQGQYMELKLHKSLAIMWPRLEHPDRGVIGASFTMEHFAQKTKDGSNSSDDEELDLWLEKNKLGKNSDKLKISGSVGIETPDVDEDEDEYVGDQPLKSVDFCDPLE